MSALATVAYHEATWRLGVGVPPKCAIKPVTICTTRGIGESRRHEVAGPEQHRLTELVWRSLRTNQDERRVIADVHARYFGVELTDRSLMPSDKPRIAPTRFEDWLSHSTA